jgi:alanine dehydrogenase
VLLLTEDDVRALLPMDVCVDALDALFAESAQGDTSNMARYRVPLVRGAQQVMAGMSAGLKATGLKTYVTGTGSDSQMLVILYSTENGEPLALLAANALGQIRTGAASGVATRHMAEANARTVAVIGSGYQARTQLAAVCAVRPITRALVYSRKPENREAFARAMSAELGISVEPAATAEEAVGEADVVCAITSAREPVFDGNALRPGTHVNAAGSNHWMRREVDETTIRRAALVVVDDVEDARRECGELIWAAERRAFRWERAVELRDVVGGRVNGRPSPEAITLFESQGLAIEDVAAGMAVYQRALAEGRGQRVSL